MKVKQFLASIILILISACATTQDTTYVKVQPLAHPVKRLSVTVIGKGDFPAALIENWAIEVLSRKGYEIVTRAEILRKVEDEQKLRGKDRETTNKSANIEGADGMFFLEVTQWKTSRQSNVTTIEEFAIVGKVVNPVGGKYLWVKNEGLNGTNLIGQILLLPVQILGGSSDPVASAVARIFNAFPACY